MRPWKDNAPSCPDPHPAPRPTLGAPFAQSRSQLGPLHDNATPSRRMDLKIIALKVFSGEKLATIYFWRAVAWKQEGRLHAGHRRRHETMRLKGDVKLQSLRGSAYYNKGEYDIAISDFNAIRLGPPSGIVFHNRGNAWRARGDYAKAIADYDAAIKADPKVSSWRDRQRLEAGARRRARSPRQCGSIRRCPRRSPTAHDTSGNFERAIADTTRRSRRQASRASNVMTPPAAC